MKSLLLKSQRKRRRKTKRKTRLSKKTKKRSHLPDGAMMTLLTFEIDLISYIKMDKKLVGTKA